MGLLCAFLRMKRSLQTLFLLAPRQLPCGHEYCKLCVEELRQKGVDKSCPLCRKPLPPGPEKLFDLGYGMYSKIRGEVDRGRPQSEGLDPWPALSTKQQRELDEAVAIMREAADQGHMGAQGMCGEAYDFGRGVVKDDRLALVYYEKAAKQGHVGAQFNTGNCYARGQGCDQNYERAAEWLEKAARAGHAGAMAHLGSLYYAGYGFPQSFERAVGLFKQGVAQGNPVG